MKNNNNYFIIIFIIIFFIILFFYLINIYFNKKIEIFNNNEIKLNLLMATTGNDKIYKMLDSIKNQLKENDYLTIVFDGLKEKTDENIDKRKNLIDNLNNYLNENIICNKKIIEENENLGYWGHGIRNKHNDLEGDFVFHIDDDDIVTDGALNKIRETCIDKNKIYIFKMKMGNGNEVWVNKKIVFAEIGTPCGIIPININKTGFWGLKYGGDYDFYKGLEKNNKIEFVDYVIYEVINK